MDSAVFKQMDSECSALFLQQIGIPSRDISVLFSCVAECIQKGRAGEYWEKAVDFFREQFFNNNFDARFRLFTENYGKEQGQKAKLSYGAVLLAGRELTIFGTGEIKVFLVNSFLNFPRVRTVTMDKIFNGEVDKETGILIAAENLWRSLDEKMVGELFFPDGMIMKKQGGVNNNPGEQRSGLERRLDCLCRKCGQELRSAGGNGIAAVALLL